MHNKVQIHYGISFVKVGKGMFVFHNTQHHNNVNVDYFKTLAELVVLIPIVSSLAHNHVQSCGGNIVAQAQFCVINLKKKDCWSNTTRFINGPTNILELPMDFWAQNVLLKWPYALEK